MLHFGQSGSSEPIVLHLGTWLKILGKDTGVGCQASYKPEVAMEQEVTCLSMSDREDSQDVEEAMMYQD